MLDFDKNTTFLCGIKKVALNGLFSFETALFFICHKPDKN